MQRKIVDICFALIIGISLLNLNGLFQMTFGVAQLASPVLLISSAILIFVNRFDRQSAASYLLLFTIFLYLVFATLVGLVSGFSADYGGTNSVNTQIVAYTSTIIMLSALGPYLHRAMDDGRTIAIILKYRNLTVISALSILFSPVLYRLFIWKPPSYESRYSGFFGNPNEAGMVACLALALILAEPLKSKLLHITAAITITFAAILTFSKTTWFVIPLIWGIHLCRRSTNRIGQISLIMGFVLVYALADSVDFRFWLVNNPYFEINQAQALRIDDVLSVFTSNNQASTILTGRDYLWEYGLGLIAERPIFGHGLGTFNYLKGGIMENGVWQGIHNVYLMVWGEAGLLPFMSLLITTGLISANVMLRARHVVAFPLALIVFLNMQVSHNILSSRYFIVSLSLLIALTALGRSKQLKSAIFE